MITQSIRIGMLAMFSAVTAVGADPTLAAPEKGEYTVEVNGLKLWYKVSGAGPLCLMPTPAWGFSSDLYFRTLKVMEKSFTVVYLDSRGTGRSGRAASPTEYSWEHLVRDMEALRSHLEQERLWLMGHSEGGMQILHYASKHPERVEGLVLLNTAAVWDDEQDKDVAMRIDRRKGQPWFENAIKALNTPAKTDEEFASLMNIGFRFTGRTRRRLKPSLRTLPPLPSPWPQEKGRVRQGDSHSTSGPGSLGYWVTMRRRHCAA